MRYIDVDNFIRYFENIGNSDFQVILLKTIQNYIIYPNETQYQTIKLLDIFRGEEFLNVVSSTSINFLNPSCHELLPKDKNISAIIVDILNNYILAPTYSNMLLCVFLVDLDILITEQEARNQDRRKKILNINNKE